MYYQRRLEPKATQEIVMFTKLILYGYLTFMLAEVFGGLVLYPLGLTR